MRFTLYIAQPFSTEHQLSQCTDAVTPNVGQRTLRFDRSAPTSGPPVSVPPSPCDPTAQYMADGMSMMRLEMLSLTTVEGALPAL